jgi:uncharacterized membrane protein YedE/YeeE
MVKYQESELYNSVVGGIFMAIASSLHLLFKGRITGVSGIFFGTITRADFLYKFSFILGLLFISSSLRAWSNIQYFEAPDSFVSNLSILGFILSGLFVGFGTKLANGCTSGHIVCGLPRLSKRSIVAVIVFILSGMFVSTFKSNYGFLSSNDLTSLTKIVDNDLFHFIFFLATIGLQIFISVHLIIKKNFQKLIDISISFGVGLIFGFGLIMSGMNRRSLVQRFLTIDSNWNPTLIIVYGCAVGLNILTFWGLLKGKPIYDSKMHLPEKSDVDFKLLIGAVFFGIGWGLSGLCPGPALIDSFIYFPHMLIFIVFMALGQFLGLMLENYLAKKKVTSVDTDSLIKSRDG